ncbi:MAG: methionine--tRNA ligase, partial [Euryarchaeota archaeon HGW-Euryarchaeota-1]
MKNIMAKERILITSALPYIHGKPHLGNLVGSLLPADVYYRFTKLFGQKSIYICGSDSHGTMFEIAAKKAGISTRDFVYRSHEEVKEVLEKFEIKPTFYGITDSENTKKLTYEIFEKLDKNGYIFEQENEMFYCEDCRLYLADRWVEGECAHCGGLARGDQCDDCGQVVEIKEILNPTCIHCGGKSVIRKKLKDLYLDLPKIWKDKNLDAWLDTNNMDSFPLAITKGYLNTGLKPRPISRAGTNWGFPIPKKGFEDKVFYVWFDAPIGYIGITKDW